MQSGNFIRNNIKKYHNVIYATSSTATLRLFQTNLWVNTDQRVCLGVELLLEGNNNGLEVLYRLVLDVIGHLKGTRGKLWAELMKGFPSQTAINTSAANRPCRCLCCPRQHQSHPGQRRGQVCSWKAGTGFEDDVQRRRVFFLKTPFKNYLWIAKSSARAATVFSPPDRLSMGLNRFPGATQL